jgi:type I restriction enzyme S subunit
MMLPKGWKLQTVDDLFHVQLGKMLNQAAKEKNPQFKYLGNSNVRWGHFETNDLKTMYFSERELGKFALQKGDIILCEGGEVGRCAIWDQDGSDIFYQKALHRLRSKGGIHPEYFQSFMYFINGSKLLDDFTTRTSIAHLTREKLLKLPVKTPPLPEQRKIAQILSTWDKSIVTTEKLIAASQQQKKALMQQLLTGKKRFAGFSEEWEEVKLQDVCYINPKKPNEPENGLVSFIPMDAVSEEAKLIRTEIRAYSDVSKGFTSFKNKDILVAKITPCFENGKGAKVSNLINGIGFGSTEFHVLRAKANISSQFIYYISNTKEFRDRGAMSMQGSAGHKRVTTDYIQVYKFSLPASYPEQQKIAAVLTAADQEIDALQSKLAHLQQEKKALMQQLLTGKRRVVLEAETSH